MLNFGVDLVNAFQAANFAMNQFGCQCIEVRNCRDRRLVRYLTMINGCSEFGR